MAQRLELLTAEGFRLDGRYCDEIRVCECGVSQKYVDEKVSTNCRGRSDDNLPAKPTGSSFFKWGNTVVVAKVHGPFESRKSRQKANFSSSGILTCEYSVSKFGFVSHRNRSGGDRTSVEIGRWIEETFAQVVLLNNYQKLEIFVKVQVLQGDGSIVPCCMNAVSLALADAGILMRDIVTCCSAGHLNTTIALDLAEDEESFNTSKLVVATTGSSGKSGKNEDTTDTTDSLVFCETGESKLKDMEKLSQLLDAGMEGCRQVKKVMREALIDAAVNAFAMRESVMKEYRV